VEVALQLAYTTICTRTVSRLVGSNVGEQTEGQAPRPQAVTCEHCGHRYIRPCTAATQAKCPNMIAKRAVSGAGPQASVRHHYIPVFYLKRWSTDDRKLCEYSRPHKTIYTRRIFPVQTGFQNRLYEKKGVPKAIAQQLEDEFMKPADTFAAVALKMIETSDQRIETDPKYRSAWSLFLMTLLTRMPEDLAALVEILNDDWERDLPRFEKAYANKQKPGSPPTLQEFIEKEDPDHMARWTMNVAPNLMDHEGIGRALNVMRWFVSTTAEDVPSFLSSDRPLFMSGTFSEADCYLTLPIAPHRLFVAVNSEETELQIKGRPAIELVQSTNIQLARQAEKYVYGRDDLEMEFVDKYISSDRPQRLLARLRDYRKEKYKPRTSGLGPHSV
jgi:hypothetical protein